MLKTAKFSLALLVGVTVLVGGCGKEDKATTRPTTAEAEQADDDGQEPLITKATKMAGEAAEAAKATGAEAAKATKAAKATGAEAAEAAKAAKATGAEAAKAAGKEAAKTAAKKTATAAKAAKTAKAAGKEAAKAAGKEAAKRPAATVAAAKPTDAVRLFVASLEKGDKKQFLSIITFDDMTYAGKLFDAAKAMRAFADAFEKAYGRVHTDVLADLRLEDAIPTSKEVASKGRISVRDQTTAVFELSGKKGKAIWLARTAAGWKVRLEKLLAGEDRDEMLREYVAAAMTCEELKDKIGQKGWSADMIMDQAEVVMEQKLEELSAEEEEEEEEEEGEKAPDFDDFDPLWLL
jgi:hypothetical protein